MMMPAETAEAAEQQPNQRVAWTCALLAVGIFVIDVSPLPLGAAAGAFHVGVVFISLWLPKWQHTFIVAVAVSVLTIVGFHLSGPSSAPWIAVVSRLLSLVAIWLVAIGGRWLVLAKLRQAEEDLQRMKIEAARARLAKSRFIDASSNDIRHHLQTLNLLNAALQKMSETKKAEEIVSKQGKAITELGDFMNALLELAELESGDVELKTSDVSVQEVLQELQQEFQFQAEAKNLQFQLVSEPGIVRTDRKLLLRTIRVLLSNAVRYTDTGSITLSASFEPEGLKITVQDTGIGIAPDEVSRIFDEFYRVNNNPSLRQGGLGLGLSIVEHSIRHLQARLEVDSEPGRGSSFSLLIPTAA